MPSRRAFALVALTLCLGASPVRAGLFDGLIAWYPLNGDVLDASGNGNHGVIVGPLVAAEDRLGNPTGCYQFDGISSYIRVPDSPSLHSATPAVTMTAWIRQDGVSLVGSGFNPILMKSNTTENAFMYRMNSASNYFGAAYNDWNTHRSAGAALAYQQWHFVAITYDGTKLRFYWNGAIVDSSALALTISSDTRQLTIGADTPGVLEIFNGRIDDVRIYNRRLSDFEITALAGATTGVEDRDRAPAIALRRVAPNPSSGVSSAEFGLPAAARVEVDVFDASGRRVRSLARGRFEAGVHRVEWDGLDEHGRVAAVGVYFWRIQSGGRARTLRAVRVH